MGEMDDPARREGRRGACPGLTDDPTIGLAHDLALLDIGVDFTRLYEGVDPDYELALWAVRSRVNETHRVQQEKAKAEAKAGTG